jgi:hypothetical protein
MRPKYLIYSQAVTAASKKSTGPKTAPTVSASSSSNKKIDPLYFIMGDKRFNVKEIGTIKAVSDGISMKIMR